MAMITMDVFLHDTVTVSATARGLGVAKLLQISTAVIPVFAVARPPVKSATRRMPRRARLRRRRRTKRSLSRDESGDAGDEGFFFDDGGDGTFGGGGFGGGGWNWGGDNWDESSSSLPDPAFDFVYEVLSWIVLSNCLHFAVKKILRTVIAGDIVGSDREKVPRRLAPIC